VRLARALALDSAFQAFGGRHRARVAANTLRRASLLAIETNDTYAQGLCELASSVVAFLAMDWERARAQLEVAETVLAEHPAGMAWELATAHLMWCVSMFFLGRLKELAHSLPALLRVAELRGDRYESTDLRLRIAHVLHLMEDEPDRAAATVEEAIASWPKTRFYLQHWWGLIAATEIALYRGDAAGAWKLFLESRVPLRRSLLMRIQYIRIETLHHRGCAAIAVAAKTGGRPAQPLLRQALDDAARLRRAKAPMATALALMLEAGVAAGREPSRAALLLAQAEAEFTALNMSLYQAVAKRCRGEILAGSGTELVAAADRWMESQGIRNPVRMSDALAPRLVVLQP
jgi:hypothetical protein